MKQFFIGLLAGAIEVVEFIYKFLNGRFGTKRLKEPYRKYWRIVMWGIVGILTIRYVVFPVLQCWSWVVRCINYVFWG